MRLGDIFDLREAIKTRPVSRVVATKAFRKALEASNSWVKSVVTQFIQHKMPDMNIPFGSKDNLLGGARAKGFWRCHLVQGRIVLLYKPEPNGVLALYDIVPHSAIEGATFSRVADALDGSITDEYIDVPQDRAKSLPPEAKSDVQQLLWEMAATDAPILKKALTGDMVDLQEYVVLTCHFHDDLAAFKPDQIFEMVISAFGGEEDFLYAVQQVLSKTGVG